MILNSLHPILRIFPLSRLIGRLTSKSYELSKMESYLSYLWSLRKEPLLVYQMGKVGSTTIVSSLKAAAAVQSKYSIHHVHWLSPTRLHYEEALYKKAKGEYTGNSLPATRFHPKYVWLGQYLSKRILSQPEKKWLVITLVREPISRNVSSFFQNLDTLLSYDYRFKLQSVGKEAVLKDLKSLFYQKCIEDGVLETFDADPLTWFDVELRRVFDVDVFSSSFPTDKGYAIYEVPRARVLLLRLEDLDKNYANAFNDFMQVQDFKLVRDNTGSSKTYSDLYNSFVRDLPLPAEYMDKAYESKYARHFYTEEEIGIFRARWRMSQVGNGRNQTSALA